MARGRKRKQQRKPASQLRQAPQGKPPIGARAKTEAAVRIPAAPEVSDIPWTAEKPQPVRRAFGVFRVGKINFIGSQKIFVYLSGALLLLSVLSLVFRGLNYGIDFTGGNKYTFKFSQTIEESVLRQDLEGLGVAGSLITVFSERPNEATVRTPYLDAAVQTLEHEAQDAQKQQSPGQIDENLLASDEVDLAHAEDAERPADRLRLLRRPRDVRDLRSGRDSLRG